MNNNQNKQFKNYQFDISLSVLNYLGRGLYRNFGTVIAEAVANAWDAGATEVRIELNQKNKMLTIEDNGVGMDDTDFRYKFLRIGYSRRIDPSNQPPKQRRPLGRKGIGKLAMLSVSEKVSIISQKQGESMVSGLIDNSNLDDLISKEDNLTSVDPYELENIDDQYKSLNNPTGTKLVFEGVKPRFNHPDILRKYMAIQFNFAFAYDAKGDDKFDIVINNTPVTQNDLQELNDKTQFVWFLSERDKDIIQQEGRFDNLKKEIVIKDSNNVFEYKGKKIVISGFIASVEQPADLKLSGSNDEDELKAGVDFFSNGRLRASNILSVVSRYRVVEDYLYGQIHIEEFDDDKAFEDKEDKQDRFTTNREDLQGGDPLYKEFKQHFKNNIFNQVINEWDKFRKELKQDGDIDAVSPEEQYKRKLQDSLDQRSGDWIDAIEKTNIPKQQKEKLKDKIRKLSNKNTDVYQDLFVLENIYREYLKILGFQNIDSINIDGIEEYKKEINKVRQSNKLKQERGGIEFKIRKEDGDLMYFDLVSLGTLIDYFHNQLKKPTFKSMTQGDRDEKDKSKSIRPIRNAIMHTNEITDEAFKSKLITSIIDNIDRLNTEQEARNDSQQTKKPPVT